MCGRYTFTDPDAVMKAIARLGIKMAAGTALPKRYNVAPTQTMPVVRGDTLAAMRWGHLVQWGLEAKPNLLINARSETTATKPTFKKALQAHRCVVPADGFFEWLRSGTSKQPYFMQVQDGAPFWMAGLYWEASDDLPETYLVLTTTPNEVMAPIHDRMPVIIPPDTFDFWLDCNKVDAVAAAAVLAPARLGLLEAYEVSTAVNRVANDTTALLDRVVAQAASDVSSAKVAGAASPAKRARAPKKDDRQSSLF